MLAALFCAALIVLGAWFWRGIAWAPPRAVIVTDFIISFLALCGLRTGFRLLREGYFEQQRGPGHRRRIGIIGAGDAGAELVKHLIRHRHLNLEPVAFFDDDARKWKTSLHGVPVQGSPEKIPGFHASGQVEEIVIAMPSATGKRIREIVHLLTKAGVKFATIPSTAQLVTGKRVTQLRPVEIEDLLGREPVKLQTDTLLQLIEGRTVLITGAGGSIGSELCRQIARHRPRRLLLVERSEFLLFQIEQELRESGVGDEMVPLVADILDRDRMQRIFAAFSPDIIFHAAAHKHVPMMEAQPGEAFRNNVLGTRLIAELALSHRASRFVLISTDKAINPTNVMGATKRVAELLLQALQRERPGSTRFMAVRFGNVLGSSGSVIPTFQRQIAGGGPVTVTHPEVTRYFMTVMEAVGLVLQSAALGQGGEIFVLDMGQPVKIVDLARQLIELSGLQSDTDIEIRFTGLRPGEKLFEELNHTTEDHIPTGHPKIMRFTREGQPLDPLLAAIAVVESRVGQNDPAEIKRALQAVVPEYRPFLPASVVS
jgi:FlaA1/EpsC-like NDP-sugar epimerase